MKRKSTIRKLPKYSAKLALSLRDIELGLKRAQKWLTMLSSIEHELTTERKLEALDNQRQLEMGDWDAFELGAQALLDADEMEKAQEIERFYTHTGELNSERSENDNKDTGTAEAPKNDNS